MDEYGNLVSGSSNEYENEEIMESTNACDFFWL